MLFDVYDRRCKRFFSAARRNVVAERLSLAHVPEVARGHFTFQQLSKMEFKSSFGRETAEGIYLRREEGDWLVKRSKLVRPAFRQLIESHWSRRGILQNCLQVRA